MDNHDGPPWQHVPGDKYAPMFGDFYGNPEIGYHHCWHALGEPTTFAKAKQHGLRTQGSDDFNIVVCRGRQVIACLWMNELIDQEQATLDDLTAVLFGREGTVE